MKWQYNKINKAWEKTIHHYWATIADAWGASDDKYLIDTYLYKCFSFKKGIWYQAKLPNFTANAKTIGEVLDMVFRYLYVEGGTCCYQRLEDELTAKGLWKML